VPGHIGQGLQDAGIELRLAQLGRELRPAMATSATSR